MIEFQFSHTQLCLHTIDIVNSGQGHPKRFKVATAAGDLFTDLPVLETVIQFIAGDSRPNTGLRQSIKTAFNKLKPKKRR